MNSPPLFSIVFALEFANQKEWALFIHLLFSFVFPIYPIFGVVVYIPFLQYIAQLNNLPPPTVLDYLKPENKILPSLLAMVLHTVVCWYILMANDSGWLVWKKSKISLTPEEAEAPVSLAPIKPLPSSGDSEVMYVPEDDDVARERQKLVSTDLESLDVQVAVRRIHKKYKLHGKAKDAAASLPSNESVQVSESWLSSLLKTSYKVAVNDLSISVDQGETVALLGPNGGGKTSSIQMIMGELVPDSGAIAMLTNRPKTIVGSLEIEPQNNFAPETTPLLLEEGDSLAAREGFTGRYQPPTSQESHNVTGYCPQHDALWPQLTIREHLTFYANVKGVKREGGLVGKWVEWLLNSLELEEHADKKVEMLSGGTKRKVCFAIALIGDPRILFLDEPSSG
jgi:ATP-binding cassette subfamily A (ABC1) protein 5